MIQIFNLSECCEEIEVKDGTLGRTYLEGTYVKQMDLHNGRNYYHMSGTTSWPANVYIFWSLDHLRWMVIIYPLINMNAKNNSI